LSWDQVEAIKFKAVERGLKRRKSVAIRYIGTDEKQFQSGQRYINSPVDLMVNEFPVLLRSAQKGPVKPLCLAL